MEDGGERLLAALSVEWDAARGVLVVKRVVEVVEEVLLDSGYAFVMNEAGKTVAIYDIGKRRRDKRQQQGDRK